MDEIAESILKRINVFLRLYDNFYSVEKLKTLPLHRKIIKAIQQKKPKAVIYLDGPFYPDTSVPPRERAQELRDRIHVAMLERSKLSDYEYIHYEKRGESEE